MDPENPVIDDDQPGSADDTRPWVVRHRRALINGSRMALVMLVIAAAALVGLGAIAWLRADPSTVPADVSAVLRSVFGTAFAVVALGVAAVIGIPSAIGLVAMSGATDADAQPALSATVRRVLVVLALATIAVTLVVLVTSGGSVSIVDLGLAGIVALALLGLAGAASYSPHRGRALASGAALVVFSAGTLLVLVRVFIFGPGSPG